MVVKLRNSVNPGIATLSMLLAITAVLFALLSPDAHATQHSAAQRHALIIVVSEYQDAQYNLPGGEADQQLALKIMQQLDVPRQNTQILRDAQATRQQVIQALTRLSKQAAKDDQVFIYISTHGGQITDDNGDEADGKDEYIALGDLQLREDSASEFPEVTGILRDDKLGQLLKAIDANKILLLDTCASGTAYKFAGFSKTFELFAEGKSLIASWVTKKTTRKTENTAEHFDMTDERLVVLSAAQDTQEAVSTSEGSRFTLALANSLDTLAVSSPYCWFRSTFFTVATESKFVQSPRFYGAFAHANQILMANSENAADPLARFADCHEPSDNLTLSHLASKGETLSVEMILTEPANLRIFVITEEQVSRPAELQGQYQDGRYILDISTSINNGQNSDSMALAVVPETESIFEKSPSGSLTADWAGYFIQRAANTAILRLPAQ